MHGDEQGWMDEAIRADWVSNDGANIDAVETAARFGINEDRAVTYHCDPIGQSLNYEEISKAVRTVRRSEKLDRRWKQKIEEDFEARKNN